MEVLLKVVIPLCLSSLGICMQLPDSLDNQNAYDFDLEVDTINDDFLGNYIKNSRPIATGDTALEQCFCLPNNSNSHPVTEQPGLKGPGLERLVVYLYKNNGLLQAFIPNKQKQILMPDIAFDENSDDILKPVFLESVGELYDSSPSIIKQDTPSTISEEKDKSDMVEIESNEPQIITEPPNDVQNGNIDDTKDEQSPDDANDFSLKPLDDTSIPNEYKPIDPQNEITENVSKPPAQDEPVTNSVLEITKNSFDPIHLQKILSMLPPDSKLFLQSLLPQLQSTQVSSKGYVKFNDWFKEQLMNIVMQNIKSPSNVKTLRQRVKVILKNNGMYLTKNDILLDSNGKVFDMANIKLRPILIGDVVEYRNLLNHQIIHNYMAPPEIPYRHMILITLISPPRVLGVVPVGKVYLPRNINRQEDILLMNELDEIDLRYGMRLPKAGCKTCKLRNQQDIPAPFSPKNGLSYYALSQNSLNSEGEKLLKQPLPKLGEDAQGQSFRGLSGDVATGLGGVFQNVLGMFGAPKLLDEPNRRFLGGILKPGARPGPKYYPNYDIPGLRIIGGNPATSSGTPLVSRGRSGFINNII